MRVEERIKIVHEALNRANDYALLAAVAEEKADQDQAAHYTRLAQAQALIVLANKAVME